MSLSTLTKHLIRSSDLHSSLNSYSVKRTPVLHLMTRCVWGLAQWYLWWQVHVRSHVRVKSPTRLREMTQRTYRDNVPMWPSVHVVESMDYLIKTHSESVTNQLLCQDIVRYPVYYRVNLTHWCLFKQFDKVVKHPVYIWQYLAQFYVFVQSNYRTYSTQVLFINQSWNACVYLQRRRCSRASIIYNCTIHWKEFWLSKK